ncbi:MAG: hypothetical protein AAGF15_06435 [Pseudomonadota bacterium]
MHLNSLSKRGAIIAAARSLVGTPFRHQGRVPGRGLDCVGLLIVCARQTGISNYDFRAYHRTPSHGALEKHMSDAGLLAIDESEPMLPAQIALMRFHGAPQHLALLSTIADFPNRSASATLGMIHAWQGAGSVVEHRFDQAWQRRLVQRYEFPGIT